MVLLLNKLYCYAVVCVGGGEEGYAFCSIVKIDFNLKKKKISKNPNQYMQLLTKRNAAFTGSDIDND